ncbi:MAG TPA: Fe-S protein assembly co-chaperone HscB [Rubrivivax sp.]
MKLGDDDFTLFGLAQRFEIDRSALDERWRALQAEVHPDRFAGQGTAAQRVAMQWSVRVNEAHRRLKDPLTRAAYLCELRGAPVAAENNNAMPADFLHQQMAWREELDDAADPSALQRIDARIGAQEQGLMAQLKTQIDDRPDMPAAAQSVRALMFVKRFRQDIDRRLEALET